jgi:hypothetical protein
MLFVDWVSILHLFTSALYYQQLCREIKKGAGCGATPTEACKVLVTEEEGTEMFKLLNVI